MFGGVERSTTYAFLVEVPKRDAATLVQVILIMVMMWIGLHVIPTLSIIQKYIKPGSANYSDEWRAYSSLEGLPENYSHNDQRVGLLSAPKQPAGLRVAHVR